MKYLIILIAMLLSVCRNAPEDLVVFREVYVLSGQTWCWDINAVDPGGNYPGNQIQLSIIDPIEDIWLYAPHLYEKDNDLWAKARFCEALSEPGDYWILFEAKDIAGNTDYKWFVVHVSDTDTISPNIEP